MTRYLIRRLVVMVVTFAVVVTTVFFLLRLTPGGPFDSERSLPPAVEQNLRAKYNLDAPLHHQYLDYISGLIRGDLGPSIRHKDFSVSELIWSGLPISLTLGAIALVIAFGIGSTLGVFAAQHQNSTFDNAIRLFATLCLALPPLISGPLLVLIVAVILNWLPAGGISSYQHFILPAITLSIPYIAAFARLARSSYLEVNEKPFVLTAKAKGLNNLRVTSRHILRAAATPVVSYVGPAAAALLAGSMIVEEIFSIPGLGRYFIQGALTNDYTLVMGAVLVYALLILMFNFIIDLLYPVLDPRVRARLTDVR